MKGFEKFLVFLLSLSFVVLALAALLIGLGFFRIDVLYQTIDWLYSSKDISIYVSIVSITFIIIGLYLLVRMLRSESAPTFSNLQSEVGEIRISTETLENLASKVAKKIVGVREEKVRVRLEEDGTVTFVIKIHVDGETPIPKISEEIQLNVKENIQAIAGVDVGNVHVVVSNVGVSNVKKARVE